MITERIPPGRLLTVSVIYALAIGMGMLLLATQRPWMGLRLAFDAELNAAVVRSAEGPAADIPVGTALTMIQSDGQDMDLAARDFIAETDGVMETYPIYEAFLRRQSALAHMQAASEVTFTDREGRDWIIHPKTTRPIASLPADFWVQVAVGMIAWLIASGVWVFRRGESSARYLLLSGWSTAIFAPFAAVYSTRELALPGELFRWLTDLNFMGGSLFAGTLVALLTCYPRRIGPKWLGWVAVLSQLGWFIAQEAGAFESMIFARRMLVMVALLATFVLAVMQWRITKRDPVGRAALRWFLLSWLVGSGVFCLFILLPQMFGFDTSAMQGYAFLLFVLVYVGLAFGILRFGLFGLDEWWVRVVTWMGALLLLVVFDMVFLLVLNLSSGVSMSLALLICGLGWLPLRGFFLNRMLARSGRSRPNVFKAVVDVALSPREEAQEALWRDCLQHSFDPLHMKPCSHLEAEPKLADDGLALLLPGVGTLSSWRLEYARGGRSLFSGRDLEAAKELVVMLRHVFESRQAYEKGVSVERGRIGRDIHDNIGAQLLSALHTREEGRREDVLRGALADLRGIINDSANPDLSIEEALGDLRYETVGRLSSGGLELDWRVEEDGGAAGLSAKIMHALRSVVREAASNILKHAKASQVRILIRRSRQNLTVVIEDDGVGFDQEAVRRGHGLTNMDARLTALNGSVTRSPGLAGKGARVTFEFPLESPEQAS